MNTLRSKMARLAIACVMGVCGGMALAQDGGIDNKHRNAYLQGLQGKRVVYIPLNMTMDLAVGWGKLLQRQADELGYTLDIRDPNWSTEVGARALSTAIAEKPDLIVLQNSDVQAYARLIKQAVSAKVKVLQLNMESLQPSDGHVGADHVGIGIIAGQELVKRCAAGKGRSTKIQVVMGVPTGPADLFQVYGLRQALKNTPEIQIVSQQATNYDPSRARAVTASVLQQHPDLCGSFGIWDALDAGTGAAVKEAGLSDQVFVITSGGAEQAACDKIQDGIFSAVVAYDVRVQGAALNAMVVALLQRKEPVADNPMNYYPPLRVITKENMHPGSCWTLETL